MKKFFITLLAALCVAAGIAGIIGCNSQNGENETGYAITVNCGAGGTYTLSHNSHVQENTEVTLTVAPEEDYAVDSFTVNGQTAEFTDNEYKFTVRSDVNIKITFKKLLMFDLFVNCGENGDYSIEQEGKVLAGSSVALTPLPDLGYEVDKVYLNGMAVTPTDGKYILNISADSAVDITFKKHIHSYGDWQITAATLAGAGSAVRTCPNCSEQVEGHTQTVELPALTDAGYSVEETAPATCVNGGEGIYTIEIDGKTFTFAGETPPTGHSYRFEIQEYPTANYGGVAVGTCSVCGAETEGHSISLDLPANSGTAYTVTDNTATCTAGGTEYTIVAHEGRYNNSVRYHVLEVSYMHPDTHLRLASQYFRSDYPIPAFPGEVEGRWAAGENIISLTGKTLRFNEELTVIKSYVPSTNGFTLTFNDSSAEGGLAAHAATEDFTLKYTKNNDTLVLINNADNSQTVCETDTSLDKVLIPEGCDGTYVSDDGQYTIVVDAAGRLSFNGVRYALDYIAYYQYSFVVDNIAYNISIYFNHTAMTLNCAALAIENVKLTKLDNNG